MTTDMPINGNAVRLRKWATLYQTISQNKDSERTRIRRLVLLLCGENLAIILENAVMNNITTG